MILRYAGVALVILLVGCSATNHTLPTGQQLPTTSGKGESSGLVGPDLSRHNVVVVYHLLNTHTAPDYLTTGSDGNIWFTSDNYAFIGKIATDGTETDYPLPGKVPANNLTPGDKGVFWFDLSEVNTSIGMMTTTGAVTLFPLPSGDEIGGLVWGPDRKVWFTDGGNNSIGNMTTMGVVTEYPLPTSNADPLKITVGPDKNLWFAELLASKIGRITPAGVITEFATTTPNQYPRGIASARDGNLYALALDPPVLLRITTSGSISQYPLPLTSPYIVIQGADDRLWIAYQYRVSSFDLKTHRSSRPISLPQHNEPSGFAVGNDGDIWFGGYVDPGYIAVLDENTSTVGIRLNGELSYNDPNYGFEIGYAVGTGTQTQTISLPAGESVRFKNLDIVPHSAALLGDATSNSAPWPGSFDGSTTKSPAGTAIGTTGWATGSLNPNKTSPTYETGLPGFYMIGCQYHYNTNEMRTVIVVH